MTQKISIIFVLFVLFLSACSGDADQNKTKTSGDSFLEDRDLLSEMPTYSTTAAGQSERIERAFQDAPPMIPHTLENLLPITLDKNMCLSCHMPEVAAAAKAIPLPPSHLTDYRPEVTKKGEIYEVSNNEEITAVSLGGKISNAVYNCTLCHAPQANVTVDIKNRFEAVFKSEDAKNKSSLHESISEGVN